VTPGVEGGGRLESIASVIVEEVGAGGVLAAAVAWLSIEMGDSVGVEVSPVDARCVICV